MVTPQCIFLKEKPHARKAPVPKREVLPDPLYSSRLVTKFVNRLMYDGKKGAAEKIFYSSLETLAEKTGEDPMRAFEKALDNVKPHMEVKAPPRGRRHVPDAYGSAPGTARFLCPFAG